MTHRSMRGSLTVLAIGALVATLPSRADAFDPFLVVPDPSIAEASPAYRYANMSDAEAFAELDKRKILYSKVDSAPGVRAPVRLTGRLHGVYIHSSLPPEERVTTPYEILDARLALALDDFAAILERHDIDELVHYTMYRPGSAKVVEHGVTDDQEAKANKSTSAPRSTQPAALAKTTPAVATTTKPIASATKPVATTTKPMVPTSPKTTAAIAKPPIAALPPLPAPAARATTKPTLGKGALASTKGNGAAAPQPKQKTIAEQPKTPATINAPTKQAAKVGPSIARAITPGATPAKKSGESASGTKLDKPASAAKLPSVASKPLAVTKSASGNEPAPGTRHPAGLAIDVGLVHKKDGRWMSVVNMFKGHIGDKTCGDGAKVADDADAREMRSLVCEPAERGVFTYILTPNFNRAHADHFHMEIRPGVRWFLHH